MKKAIIMGASSGIGHEVARLLINEGWTVGVAARRIEKLTDLLNSAPERVFTAQIDVTEEHADASLSALITRMDGIDIYLHVAGIGWQNPSLEPEKEIKTMETNATGFTRMVGAAYRYFAEHGGGHIACITSIAGTVLRRLCRTLTYRLWNNYHSLSIITLGLRISVRALLTLLYSLEQRTSQCL